MRIKLCDSRFNKIALLIAALFALGIFDSHAAEISERFQIDTEGNGKNIIVIPGLTSSPTPFKQAIKDRSGATYHWITLAGFAGTKAPENLSSFTMPAAKEIAHYIKDQNLKDVRLVGHSMGGIVSLMIANEIPDHIHSIMIVDSVPFLPQLFNPAATPEQMAMQKDAMRTNLEMMSREQFESFMRQGLNRQAISDNAQAIVWDDIKNSDQKAVAVASSEVFTQDYSLLLAQIKIPVTILVPYTNFGFSQEVVVSSYKRQYAELENATFHIIEDSRHFIMLDQPEAFASHLEDFINE